jgi:hypothetical protein
MMETCLIKKIDTRVLLSTLWIFVILNYLYCDLIGLMDANFLKGYLSGNINGMQITQGFLLGASILMEISIAMVLLSRILKYRANRFANIIAGTITTLVQTATLFIGPGTMYYLFFSILEIATTASIICIAWQWTKPQDE